jgi:molybdopterin converting factor subunit 1
MTVSLRFFASLREAVGQKEMCLDMADGATIDDLKARLSLDFPKLEAMLPRVVCAIDDEYVASDERLRDGAQVALIPPVSGGATPAPGLYWVTYEPLDGQKLADLVRTDADGAVTLFYGVVRNNSEGRDVERLEYEAHESMAARQLEEVANETKARFPEVTQVGAWHRIGTLELGEASLLVAVSSPHRKASFDACHWCVDRIKEVVPVWKKEHWTGGSAWVEGHAVEPPTTAST